MSSYSSISLINQHAKIFTAILANRLNTCIGKYIAQDENGFLRGRQTAGLMRRALNVMHTAKELKMKARMLSLDIYVKPSIWWNGTH